MHDNTHDNAAFEKEETKIDVPSDSLNKSSKEISIQDSQPENDLMLDILYGVEEVPPWHLTILLGMQQYLTMVGSTISIPFILTDQLCIADDNPVRGTLVSTIIFVSGIATLLQTTFGVRLPIVQGGTFAFLVPTIAIIKSNFPACETYDFANMTEEATNEVWMVRMREIQGDIIVASIFQVVIGFTGLIGLILRWITPLTIAPTITLIGFSLFDVAAKKASGQWGLALFTMGILILFSQYLAELNVPLPKISGKKFTSIKVQIFKLFPVLLTIVISWLLCVILTETNALPMESKGRTDSNANILWDAPWFRIPYPFQFGVPTVTLGGVLGILAGVLASIIESVGDYYACARLSGATPPPTAAINRGIGFEGIGCIIAGFLGSGNGTTSYSENIGAIRVTKVGSRVVIQVGAIVMILFGVFSKFGALFVTLPSPIVGGLFFVLFGMITAIGISNLQFVDMNSSRNLFVLGFSLFFGMALPKWFASHDDAIKTGVAALDQIFTVLLSTSMFVGGLCGIILDNTVPGTLKERGVEQWNKHLKNLNSSKQASTYDLPFGMNFFRRHLWCRKVPISPTYGSQND